MDFCIQFLDVPGRAKLGAQSRVDDGSEWKSVEILGTMGSMSKPATIFSPFHNEPVNNFREISQCPFLVNGVL